MNAKYKVGDKVRIVKEWRSTENVNSLMNKWLGKVMTIRAVEEWWGEHEYRMEEDVSDVPYMEGWHWYNHMIEGLANEDKKIVIISHGNEVKATLYNDKKFAKEAKAVCNPVDEFNLRKGAELALERLLKEEPKKCPFCGGEAKTAKQIGLLPPYTHIVRCCKCGTATRPFETEAEAIDAWNKREE